MVVSKSYEILLIFIITVIILGGDTQEPNLSDYLMDQRNRNASKRITNNAMDIMFGNKSMIDALSKEFSDVVSRYTTKVRPIRSPLGLPLSLFKKDPKPVPKEPRKISRVEINFINRDNQIVHTIMLQPARERKTLHAPDYSKTLLHI